MAIDKTTFIPKLWEATILRAYENNIIAKQICYTDFTGEIKKMGDSVTFPGLADPTVSKYTNSINYEDLENADVTLIVDQQDYFGFKVSDIIAAQSNVNVQGSQAERAGYKLRDNCDKYVLGLHTEATHEVTNEALTSANVISAIGEMNQKLDEANVPNEQKWIVIPPWVKLKLMLAGIKFSIKEGSGAMDGTEWTKELGFNLYVSNNIALAGGSSYCLGGSKGAIAFADQLTKIRAMELEDSFDTGVSGLHVYGAKVLKPDELVKGVFKAGAETTI